MLVEKAKNAVRIASVNQAAARAGLRPGLSLADARARFPVLEAAAADPVGDGALIDHLALLAERFTPAVALDPPLGLVLDMTGATHPFGGEEGARAAVVARFRALGLSVRAAIASTPDCARALARLTRVAVAVVGEEAALVRPLPLRALELDPASETALRRAGLKTVGDVADRPSVALSARFGERLARKLRRLLGEEDARLVTLRRQSDCAAERQFAEPLAHMEATWIVLGELLGAVAGQLEARHAGGRRFEARFFRSDGAVRSVSVETSRPLRDTAAVMRLFRERLDALADPLDPGFGFDCLRLEVPVAEPLAPAEVELGGGAGEEASIGELIDRLVARLGAARVRKFLPRDTHDPARAVLEVPASLLIGPGAIWEAPEADGAPTRPLCLFAAPQPIEALAEVPDGPPRRFRWRGRLHESAFAEGPERIAAEWWRAAPTPTRDYYRVEDRAGRRFWLFRDGMYGETPMPRWYVHGLFA